MNKTQNNKKDTKVPKKSKNQAHPSSERSDRKEKEASQAIVKAPEAQKKREDDNDLIVSEERHVIQRKKLVKPRSETAMEILTVNSVDRPFLILVIILLCIGTVMVFTASYANAEAYNGDSYFYSKKQVIWVAVSIAAMIVAANFNYRFYEKFVPVLFIISFILLALVPVIGKTINHAKRWIGYGSLSFQPSELVKITVVLFIAWYATKHPQNMKRFWKGFVFLMLPVGVIDLFLYKQPHLSGMIIVTFLAFVMLYFADANRLHLLICGILGVIAIAFLVAFTDHGSTRIRVWLNPEQFLQNEGWQPYQSKIAIGSGGIWGVGLGQSRQKHLYLPEPQNDYIFSILCEEMGFVFAVGVIILFLLLIWRGYYIARHAPRRFPALVAMGLTTHIAVQAFLNIAVVTNAIPATGVSLPFFSYGGTSLVFQMIEMGMILNISKYSAIERR